MAEIVRRTSVQPVTSFQGLPPIVARIYANREVASQNEIERDLAGLLPFSVLMNIELAVTELSNALEQQKKILIVGDFDADGATSTALAVTALRQFGAKHVDFLVPNRFEYGYGLSPEIVEVAKTKAPDLIITVDNGISSIEGVAAANQAGIKVLITDHHLPGSILPEASAIVNPNLKEDQFPSKNLAGVGVIFYVMLALRSHLRQINWFFTQSISEPNMADFLDLVALGTVADLVKLDKNNRILVHHGLQRIRASKTRCGIQALIEIAGSDTKKITASDLGFLIAPRLNAAGRLQDMSLGIHCLISEEAQAAKQMALQLNALNEERKVIEREMKQQAQEALKRLHFKQDLPNAICLYDPTWHQGVIGIVAARIKEKVHRPVIVFANGEGETLKGSARSIKGIHIRDVLADIAAKYPLLMEKFGGHAMAAGLTLSLKNYPTFEKIFAEEVTKYITDGMLENKIYSDGELSSEELSLEVAKLLREAGPWGQGFPEPLFDNVFNVLEQRIVGENHLKLLLGMGGQTKTIDAIAFHVDLNSWPNHRCQQIRAAYRLDINEFRGLERLQLLIEHLEPAR